MQVSEMAEIVTEPLLYTKIVRILGKRHNSKSVDLSNLLPKSSILEIKRSASESMGLDLSQEDIINIDLFCRQVIALSEHRDWLQQYIRNRITMISLNLIIMVE
jgi:RNA processing factor Prp31